MRAGSVVLTCGLCRILQQGVFMTRSGSSLALDWTLILGVDLLLYNKNATIFSRQYFLLISD
ncbi:hypothetical protein BQ8794_160106 [Mesorhizobium prunaredense]|uniref:Uncharacterized protein n=1 Tax=Mesorhizobium prunaredense TaxID=1631249 RepID=A0A1R3V3K8_9HYPH|nr:hypothetical protein BQ8794_160106 [Mesorhizobium prunaredense]